MTRRRPKSNSNLRQKKTYDFFYLGSCFVFLLLYAISKHYFSSDLALERKAKNKRTENSNILNSEEAACSVDRRVQKSADSRRAEREDQVQPKNIWRRENDKRSTTSEEPREKFKKTYRENGEERENRDLQLNCPTAPLSQRTDRPANVRLGGVSKTSQLSASSSYRRRPIEYIHQWYSSFEWLTSCVAYIHVHSIYTVQYMYYTCTGLYIYRSRGWKYTQLVSRISSTWVESSVDSDSDARMSSMESMISKYLNYIRLLLRHARRVVEIKYVVYSILYRNRSEVRK